MSFLEEFLRVLLRRPGSALLALYWYITRRRVRARNTLRRRAHGFSYFYPAWIKSVERNADVIARAPPSISGWKYQPRFTLLFPLPPGGWTDGCTKTILSLQNQCYEQWELLIIGLQLDDALPEFGDERVQAIERSLDGDTWGLRSGVAAASGDYVSLLTPGDILPPTALFHYAETLQDCEGAAILYGDEDRINQRRRCNPWFKSEWNHEMFLAQDYMSKACMLETRLAREIVKNICDPRDVTLYRLLLEAAGQQQGAVVHVAHILNHVGSSSPENDQSERLVAVAAHVEGRGGTAAPGPHGTVSVSWPLPVELPRVSIIIPTRDKVRLLRTCVESLVRLTEYQNYEIIIIDNGSIEQDTVIYLDDLSKNARMKIQKYDLPFNYSSINNFAARLATGDFICLLNNDTEVIDGGWLAELMRYAVRPSVGAVGAKLLYGDRSIQHAGVVIGLGGAAGHAHRHLQNHKAGYFSRAHVPHFVSAVTGACLLVEKRKFDAVGGLDEGSLQVAFNDVDLCLKLQKAGWRNVYAPQAFLIHHESKSRGKDLARGNRSRFMRELGVLRARWGTDGYVDPLHHPSLDPSSETYVIKL